MLQNAVVIILLITGSRGEDDVVRETRQGRVRGKKLLVMNTRIEEYKGIPYAQPPVGDLRFKPPFPGSSWKGTLDTTRVGLTACPQNVNQIPNKNDISFTEDCLHLHIWTPATKTVMGLPVLLWIHGGGFHYGSASFPNMNGSYLAANTGYVVLAANYRLGVLGFLNANSPEAPGNMGILDQHMALRWVQENIEAFGGDPSMVTLVGPSAGSQSVNIHILSPMSRHLFKRAIMASGTAYTPGIFDTVHESVRKGNVLAKNVGCLKNGESLISNAQYVIRCLRLKPTNELILAASEIGAMKDFPFFPTFHDDLLPKSPSVALERGFFNDVDVLTGVTNDEGAIELLMQRSPLLHEGLDEIEEDSFGRFLEDIISGAPVPIALDMLNYYVGRARPGDKEALRRMHIDYHSDRFFKCPAVFFAESYSRRGNSVYTYVFGHKNSRTSLPSWMGVPHGHDIEYMLAVPPSKRDAYGPEDIAVSECMVQIVASFAKYG